MSKQLRLIETEQIWRLDDHTRDLGRAGIAAARAVLAEAHTHYADRDRDAA